ncbi:MAG TPA: hypothetical protein VN976_22370 [Verrucomicrobiae bacterium]|nr:hypothetical protein [Verrucomicrobiae bacterium]
MKRTFLAAVCLLFFAQKAPAQTVSPVIVEYANKADGRFQVYNDADIPITVVVEPHSFTVDSTGKAVFRKLDPGLHVELSSTSFRLAPKQTYYVFYKATTESYPNWFCIYSTVSGPVTATGLKLAIELPHTVYLLGHKTLEESNVSWNKAELTVVGGKRRIMAQVENHGTEYGRVQEVEVVSSTGKQTFSGFPLFPGQRRDIEFDWDQPGTPKEIVLKFPHFKMESSLKEHTAAQ